VEAACRKAMTRRGLPRARELFAQMVSMVIQSVNKYVSK
jgi:hypothetical protein